MKRMTIAVALSALLAVGVIAPVRAQVPAVPAQTTTPKPAAPVQATAPKPAPKAVLPFPPDAKIGFMNLQLVIVESKFGQAGRAKLEDLTNKKTVEVGALNKRIQGLQSELQTQSSVLSPLVVQQKTGELDRLQRQLQFDQQQASADIDGLRDQLFEEFQTKVMPIAEAIRKEKGLWFILAVGDSSGVIALDEALDLSLELVRRLDGATK